ncbi:hypothetical protein FIBSPDRAFT_838864 [Athelia psychrophila]|uniref:Heme haloperoxidase family profile domain-containing protein n=1 Tax=Athelia psychrophila TaxID=1759441 RepID=A0A165YYQ5_9AGAM|nr:hypothetical protein FIBSPDRAFT_838864 [Fibularhizoctonia sp. CBS 109695]
MIYFPPQTGDVRSLLPALGPVTDHGHLSHNGKHISILTFARPLSPPSEVTFILLQLIPLSLSDIAWHDRIDYDVSLVHTNTSLEEEYTPDGINRDLLEAVMNHGKGARTELRKDGAQEVLIKLKTLSPALDRMHAEIARGEMAIVLRVLAAPDAGIPLPWLRTWIHDETFPAGWAPNRTVGLVDAVRESGRIRVAMNPLVAAQSLGDTREAEAEHLLVEQEESDGDEGTPEEGNFSLFSSM